MNVHIPIEIPESEYFRPNIWEENWKEYNFDGLIIELDGIEGHIEMRCPKCGSFLFNLNKVKWIPRYEGDKGYGGSHPNNWKVENSKNYDNETKTIECHCGFKKQVSFFSYGG